MKLTCPHILYHIQVLDANGIPGSFLPVPPKYSIRSNHCPVKPYRLEGEITGRQIFLTKRFPAPLLPALGVGGVEWPLVV